MAIQVKEVHKFDKGIHGSISEHDISSESASLSLNIDPNSEYGSLRGIYGDKILSAQGWEVPRLAQWNIKFFTDAAFGYMSKLKLFKKLMILNAYDKQFLLVFVLTNSYVENRLGGTATDNTLGNIGINSSAFYGISEYNTANASGRLFNVIPVLLEDYIVADNIKVGHVADAVKKALDTYAVPTGILNSLNNSEPYFYSYRPTNYTETSDLEKDGTLQITSRFFGDIPIPNLPLTDFSNGADIDGTSLGHTSGLYLPDSEIYTTNSTKFVKGNGFSLEPTLEGLQTEESSGFNFFKLKAFNSKGLNNLIGITTNSFVKIAEDITNSSSFNFKDLGSVNIKEKNSLSIEQRNKNLYVGVGDEPGTSSLWIGHVSKNQLDKVLEGYYLEENSLDSLDNSVGINNFSNIVVPTLHHGLNNTNGGIAGAASLYCLGGIENGSRLDAQMQTLIIAPGGTYYKRSVNGWVRQCLKNNGGAASTYNDYDDVKLGMTFRVDLGDSYVAPNKSTFGDSAGKNAFDYLLSLKEIAVGKLNDTSNNDLSDGTEGGSGETLHDGDLFQVVYVPDAATIAYTPNDDTSMFRLVYVGSLFGNGADKSKADSTEAYCGISAYSYAHINDENMIHRIKNTSKSDEDIQSLNTEFGGYSQSATDSVGGPIKLSKNRVDSLNIAEELSISDFKISTMCECKSTDGAGNFGGELTDKNYFTGHGKLWVANVNEPEHLYIVDVTNWDGTNRSLPKLSYVKIELSFDRIHSTLISKNDTEYGKGLLRLWENDENGSASQEKEEEYFSGYSWDKKPVNNFISSICETYSHLPHMGDGAGGGAANGDGKWRVWVEYKKNNNSAHIRYDLFLYNFRPQSWGSGEDVGTDISSSDNIAYMFDKTPPNQECQKINGESETEALISVYYPFDKVSIIKYEKDGEDRESELLGNTNDKEYGNVYASKAKGSTLNVGKKHLHNDTLSNKTVASPYTTLNFRNPSGEYQKIFPPEKVQQWMTVPLGVNIGWSLDNTRQYTPVRHSLKPYYRKWYFTGNGGSNYQDSIPFVEEESYLSSTANHQTFTAHLVSSFGKMKGSFVSFGGALLGGRRNTNITNNWWLEQAAKLKDYNNEYVMFNMHDSPVAIETYNSTAYETQGAPTETVGTDNVTVGGATRKYFKDTEAGFLKDRSVVATLGYSKYNQYRYHHANNGTADLSDDSADTGKEESYALSNTYGYGGQYFGQDGFGHYNMITQTWACNQDYLINGDGVRNPDNSWSDETVNNKQFRVFGWGEGSSLRRANKRTNTYWDGTPFEGHDANAGWSKHGTGYFTWLANTHDNTANGDDVNEFYSNVTNTESTSNTENFRLSGKHWDNRRIVHCWSTTALTDSVNNYSYEARNNGNKLDHREWGLWKTPRCSFRKLIIPESFGSGAEITNVDQISWAERNVNSPNPNVDSTNTHVIAKSGYIVQYKLEDSSIDDLDSSSTGVVVYETKTNTFYAINPDRQPWEDNTKPYQSHSIAATDYLRALHQAKDIENLEGGSYRHYHNYSNTKLITKNLVPGLADSGIKDANYTNPAHNWYRFNSQQSASERFIITDDLYCPIVISQDGSEAKQEISIWKRAQFSQPGETVEGLGDFPYYIFDRLWNYWTKEVSKGFDRSNFGDPNSTYNADTTNKYITEGWGSTVGASSNVSSGDKRYPGQYTTHDADNTLKTVKGAHVKSSEVALLTKLEEVNDNNSQEFPAGIVKYKFSFLYDGFQESPLNTNAFAIQVNAQSSMLRLKLTVPDADSIGINSRVTHINMYRKNNTEELYRLVKSVSLDMSKDNWGVEKNMFIIRINDEQRLSSYEGLNGIPESLSNLTPNYRLSCQLNDFLFIGGLHHPNLEDGDHLLLRSKQGRFSVFDWSNDFLDIPTKPVAMASFANRVWIFDNNNMYKINPTGLYIEDKTEGIGILNSESFIVTDMGMFWCDRSNIYKHDGTKINQIGTSILKNHSHPEWQIGYLDAVNKSEKLGFTPKIGYDPINQSIYVTLQGFSKSLLSYKKYEGRIYSYDIKQDRWDYYDSPSVKSLTTDSKSNVIISDGLQVFNYRRDKKNVKKFSWDSKTFQLGSSNYTKSLKALKFTGDICLWNFNNSTQNVSLTAGGYGEDVAFEEPEFSTGKDNHILETGEASETDDLKVYVDGILQTMRLKTRNPVIGPPIANDSTGEIYAINTQLPSFGTKGDNLSYEDSFSINNTSCPEFLEWPNSQFREATLEGELNELLHIHKGMYLYFKGIDINGITQEEVVRVRDIKFSWLQGVDGLNTLSGPIEVRTWRGQLGTKAYNWSDNSTMPFTNIEPIRTASPTFLFPRGLKGKTVKLSLQNQKSFIDSFAISYRVKKFK
jgi:hypothetical protein|tara:strand:+ start:5545 stop:12600 length:7056 start_codon:yes stop_codon:yes gene_type:complete